MRTEELLQRIKDLHDKVFPQTDSTRNITLTGSVQTLPNESCKSVTIINTTGADLRVTTNGGTTVIIPNNAGITVGVTNTNKVTVNGTATQVLSYLISE